MISLKCARPRLERLGITSHKMSFLIICTRLNNVLHIFQIPYRLFKCSITMKKYKVLQLGLQLGFQQTFATHGIYATLSVIEQVVVDTLCHIQYHIYCATHMQLYVTSL
jgi:hypothetical protein